MPLAEEIEKKVDFSGLAQELHERGLSKAAAMELSQTHPEDHIREKIEMYELLRNSHSVSENPAGWLRRAIEEDYKLSEKQRKTQETHAREHAEQDRQAR